MFQFTEDCFVGVESIDEEHKKLFAMMNEGIQLLESDDETALAAVKGLVVSLKKYAEEHFANEEAYMERIGDCELERQKKEHTRFKEYMDNYSIAEVEPESARESLRELLLYLSRWLYGHILGSDIMIGHNTNLEDKDKFAFTEKYQTGIELIDKEHKELFGIIKKTNDLIHAELLHDKYDAIVQIIGELKEYTVTHFSDEEAYMTKIHYEGLEAQKMAHAAFVDTFAQINLDNVDDNQQEYLTELVDYLLNWLATHILKMDKRIPLES